MPRTRCWRKATATDGSGLGFFARDGKPVLDKQPEAAFANSDFSHQTKTAVSETFVAPVRIGTAGRRTMLNTHPFAMAGRLMAHNGGFGDIGRLDARLGSYRSPVQGKTDSERYFALITQQIDGHQGV